MSLDRRAIREALVTCLAGETSAGAAVESNRGRPRRFAANGRAITVWYGDEAAEVENGSERLVHEYERVVELAIELHVSRRRTSTDEGDETDDVVDELGHEVECLLLRDTSLAGAACGSRYLRTEFDFTRRGRQLIGAAALVWEFRYYTRADVGAGPQSLTPWQTAHLDIDAQPPQGELDTTDVASTTDLPQV